MSTFSGTSNRNSADGGSVVGGVGTGFSFGMSTGFHMGRRLFAALMPSFIADRLAIRANSNANSDHADDFDFHRHGQANRRRRAPKKLHATSYLDGLRGLAACSVFAYHYTDYNHKFFLPLWGYNTGDEIPSSFMQLPWVRLCYSGTPMVHVFFVISGFALSLGPLRCLHDVDRGSSATGEGQGQAKAQSLIASGVFRRPLRLFIPPLGATFLAAFVVYVFGWMPTFMKPKETLWGQVTDWADDAIHRVMWPWAWDDTTGSPHSRYNPHLWTIPMEFVHSMLLFLVLLVLTRLRGSGMRKVVLGALMVYTLVVCTRWAAFEFLGGALLAEMHLGSRVEEERLPSHGNTDGDDAGKSGRMKKTLQIGVLIAAGYILSWPPRKTDMTPTFEQIQSLAPSSYGGGDKGKNFWLAVAAFATVWSVGRIDFIRTKILMSSLAQYAGRISFCLYIFQHLVLNLMQHHTLGSEYKAATKTRQEELPWGVRGTFGISSMWQRTVTWWVGLLIMGFVLVCLADFGTRMLDAPAVRVAKRVESWAFGLGPGRSESMPTSTEQHRIPMGDMIFRGGRDEDRGERAEK